MRKIVDFFYISLKIYKFQKININWINMNHQSEKWLFLYTNDIPQSLDLGSEVAVDTETMGLKFRRDRLCLVQLATLEAKFILFRSTKTKKLRQT